MDRPKFPQLAVLAVEDFEFNMEIITEMLGVFGIVPDTAENGKVGLEMAEKKEYDLILMDIRMPLMDGYQATEAIRKLERAKKPIIVALTASAALNEREKFQGCGMNDFLIKPIELNDLQKLLTKYFGPT